MCVAALGAERRVGEWQCRAPPERGTVLGRHQRGADAATDCRAAQRNRRKHVDSAAAALERSSSPEGGAVLGGGQRGASGHAAAAAQVAGRRPRAPQAASREAVLDLTTN